MSRISSLLKQARESHGLTLEDVAQRTYIKLPYLQALEEGLLEQLPAPVYTYGYIRQYAKLLGLDGGALVAEYQQHEQGGPSPAVSTQRSLPAMADTLGESFPTFKRSNGGASRSNGASAYPAMTAPSEAGDLRQAQAQAQQIVASAERDAQQLVRGAERYADEVLAELEGEIGKALQTIRNGRQFLASRRQLGPGPGGL